jgi:hypothetical protein
MISKGQYVKESPKKSPTKQSSPLKKISPQKKSVSPVKKEFKENDENYSQYSMPKQVTQERKANPMTKYLNDASEQVRAD